MSRLRIIRRWFAGFVAAIVTSGLTPTLAANDADSLAQQLANPVASLISVPLQLNWDSGLGDNGLGTRWLLNVQPVIPMPLTDHWNVISRTIVPFEVESSDEPGSSQQSGLGDITQSFFFSPTQPIGNGWIIGAGPAILIPSATQTALGHGKWGLGPTLVALKQSPTGLTVGILWNHIWSVAGSSDREAVNATYLQPFISQVMGGGLSVTANLESTYDWEGHHWVVPMNLTATQVTSIGGQRVSVGAGLRWYLASPAGGPTWGLRLVFTLLYPK